MRSDWRPGKVEARMLVRKAEQRQKRDGNPYLALLLGDKTGTVDAHVWDNIRDWESRFPAGTVVNVTGQYKIDEKYGAGLTVKSIAATRDQDYADMIEGPAKPAAELEEEFVSLCNAVSGEIRAVLNLIFMSDLYDRFRVAPAARVNHEAYRHGLLEHTVSVARTVWVLAQSEPAVSSDLAVAGALLHDVGKADAYTLDPLVDFDLTDEGKLFGEIPCGYYRVRSVLDAMPDFPQEAAWGLLHIILSHHGRLEWGSPVVPCTREAVLVHYVDMVHSRFGAFARLEDQLPDGTNWSPWDKVLGSRAWLPTRPTPAQGVLPELEQLEMGA